MFAQNFTTYEVKNFGYLRLPKPPLDEICNKYKIQKCKDNDQILQELCDIFYNKAVKENKFPTDAESLKKYREQIKIELDTFKELHFTDYILLIFAIMEKMGELGIFKLAGRGSAAGSLVFFLLEITKIDPIKHELFFTRFISKARAESKIDESGNIWIKSDLVPDVDLDLGSGREQVVEWLSKIYPNRVCKILTIGTLSGKILLKDVHKTVDNVSEDEANFVSKMLERKFGVVDSLSETVEKNEQFQEWTTKYPQTFRIACRLENLNRQKGVHASGYLISFDELTERMPIQRDSNGEMISSYTMKYVPAIKVDLLGLTTSTIIKNVIDAAHIDERDIELEHNPEIYDRFQDGKLLPYGLFQIGADTAFNVTNKVKPKNLNELSDVNAIARPGALQYIDDYVKPETEWKSPHPFFDDILRPTRYQPLYQEQTMAMAVKIGFTKEESEQLRRVIGKKQLDKIKEWKDKIYQKCEENKLDKGVGDALWTLAEASASYSFNKSHSMAYASTSALTVYLKYKYPQLFFLECLKDIKNHQKPQEEINAIMRELPLFGIKLLPPSLTKSEMDFSLEGNDIRFGLQYIKGVSTQKIAKVNAMKKEYRTRFDLFDAANTNGLDVGAMSALIQSGAMDEFVSQGRSYLVSELRLWNLLTEREKIIIRERFIEQSPELDLIGIIKKMAQTLDGTGRNNLIKEKRLEKLRKDFAPHYKICSSNEKNESFANWWYEFKLLGFAHSQKLHQVFLKENENLIGLKTASDLEEDEEFISVGIITNIYEGKSKSGNRYMRIEVSDESTALQLLLFSSDKVDSIQILAETNGRLPKEGDVINFQAKKKAGAAAYVRAKQIVIQTGKIYMKFGEFKRDNEEN